MSHAARGEHIRQRRDIEQRRHIENVTASARSSVEKFHDDAEGNVRARLGVASDGSPALEFLDSAGTVTHRYPPN